MEDYEKKIERMEKEIDELKDGLLDITYRLNHSKENELLDFVRTLYREVSEEYKEKKDRISRERILSNLKKYIENFAKDNRIEL